MLAYAHRVKACKSKRRIKSDKNFFFQFINNLIKSETYTEELPASLAESVVDGTFKFGEAGAITREREETHHRIPNDGIVCPDIRVEGGQAGESGGKELLRS